MQCFFYKSKISSSLHVSGVGFSSEITEAEWGLMKYFNLDIKKRVERQRHAQEKGKTPMRMGRNFSRKTYRD